MKQFFLFLLLTVSVSQFLVARGGSQSTPSQPQAQTNTPPANTYTVLINGQQYGPLPVTELQLMAQAGTFTRETPVMRTGTSAWIQAGEVPELAAFVGRTSPSPQPAPAVSPPPAAPPLPSASRYTVAINGQQQGPYDMTQLQQLVQGGTLTRETLVWTEGMAQWAEAGTLQELMGLFTSVPPPLPPGR